MSNRLFKYQIYCITESTFRYDWSSTPISACPINGGHSVNPNSVSEVKLRLTKNITFADSPYFGQAEILLCDTTDGIIEIRLPEASVSTFGSIFLKRVNGSNNVELFNGTDVAPFDTITISDNPFRITSDGSVWAVTDDRFTNEDDENLELINDAISSTYFVPRTFTKGSIPTGDDNGETSLPVGSDNQIIFADSTEPTGLRWGNFISGPTGHTGPFGPTGPKPDIESCQTLDVYGGTSAQTFTTPITVNLDNTRISSTLFTINSGIITVNEALKADIHYKLTTDVSANGIIESREGYSINRISIGIYEITLDNPHPEGTNFPVVVSLIENTTQYAIRYVNVSSTVFRVAITEQLTIFNGGGPIDSNFSFLIPNNNNYTWGIIDGSDPSSSTNDGTALNSPVSISRGYLEISTNNGVLWTLVDGSEIFMYNRKETFGRATASGNVHLNMNSGDQLRLRVERNQGTLATLSTVANANSLSITRHGGPNGPTGPKGDPGGPTGPAGGVGPPGPAGPINGLSDVTITSPQNGDLLQYNGSIWVNSAVVPKYLCRTSTVNGATIPNTTFVYIQPWETDIRTDSIYSVNGGDITINQSGWFDVSVNINLDTSSSRTTAGTVLYLNDALLANSLTYSYHRSTANGEQTAVINRLVNITSGDILQSRCRKVSGSTLVVRPESRIVIKGPV